MTKKILPLKPGEVGKAKKALFPDEVLEAFNQLIAMNFSEGSATVKQEDVVAILKKKGLEEKEIFKNGWLNVEEVYRDAGWKVEYDKPAYCESYPAIFIFKR